ncbi:MAG: oligosaccharide flippase family protein [Chloroflexus sp.]|uniref:oligosaccharide flippase family protein n=1 Tax=Chloroflexus sp. TaxID=1904827 RepID=UPI00404ABD13
MQQESCLQHGKSINYFLFRNKCYFQFQNMSFQQVIFAVTLSIFAIPLTSVSGISGFIIGQAASAFLACLLAAGLDSTKIALHIGLSELKPLIRVGFPIMFAGILYSFLTSIDRWVIVNLLGLEYVGRYTIAILCFGALSVLPAVISQQIYPRMAFLFGKTRDRRSLLFLVI